MADIQTDEQAEYQRLFELLIHIARFCMLSNAGGAVAVLSFMGATAAGGNPIKGAVVPLIFFAFGVIFAGLTMISIFSTARAQQHERRTGKVPKPNTWSEGMMLGLKDGQDRLIPLSFICLFLGVFLGLLMIVFA